MADDNINTDLLFQCIGAIFVIVGTLLIYQGPKFLNVLLITISYIIVYALGFKLVNESESAQIILKENLNEEFQNVIVFISPGIFAYFASRFIQQSLSTLLMILRIGIFALFGYAFCCMIMSKIDESELYFKIDHVQIYATNIKFLSTEQNVAFCVFALLSLLYAMSRKTVHSLIIIAIICGLCTISYFFDIPMLQSAYNSTILYLLSHSQKVDISLKLLMPIIGMISSLLIGYNIFDDNMIQSGISMICGILLAAFGFVSILSGSNKDTLVPSMLCFTAILIMLGTTRKIYIPSNTQIRKLAKQKFKQIIAAKNRRKSKKKQSKQGVKQQKIEKKPAAITRKGIEASLNQELSKVNDAMDEKNPIDDSESSLDTQDPIEFLANRID